MKIRDLTDLAGEVLADIQRELAAAREVGYIEAEVIVTLPKTSILYAWLNDAAFQFQIMLPTSLAKKAAEPEESNHAG